MVLIRILFLIAAWLLSIVSFLAGLGIMLWIGTVWPSVARLCIWLLPLMSLPVFFLSLFMRKVGILTYWFLFLGNCGAIVGVFWDECIGKQCSIAHPGVRDALKALDHSYNLAFLLAAICLQIAWQIEKANRRNESSGKLVAD